MSPIPKLICLLGIIVFPLCSQSQELKLQYEERTEYIRKGDFIQCIAIKSDSNRIYVYGKVEDVRLSGIRVKRNPLLPGSGGFLQYQYIDQIAKVKIVNKSILPALMGGYIIGQLTFINNIPAAIGPLVGGSATYLLLLHAVKYNRKNLRQNRVNETVFLKPPTTQYNGELYYENK